MNIPDYANAVTKSWNTDIIAESNGFVLAHTGRGQDNISQVYVNGKTIGYSKAHYTNVNYFFPVAKGDKYKLTGGTGSSETDGNYILFVPSKNY